MQARLLFSILATVIAPLASATAQSYPQQRAQSPITISENQRYALPSGQPQLPEQRPQEQAPITQPTPEHVPFKVDIMQLSNF